MSDVVRIYLFIAVKIVVPTRYNKKCKGFNQHCTTGPPYPQPCCPGYVCKKKCGGKANVPKGYPGGYSDGCSYSGKCRRSYG